MKIAKEDHLNLCMNLYILGDLIGAIIDIYPNCRSEVMLEAFSKPMKSFTIGYCQALMADSILSEFDEYLEWRINDIDDAASDLYDSLPTYYQRLIVLGYYKGKLMRSNQPEKIIKNVGIMTGMAQDQIMDQLGIEESDFKFWLAGEKSLSVEKMYDLEKLIFDKWIEGQAACYNSNDTE